MQYTLAVAVEVEEFCCKVVVGWLLLGILQIDSFLFEDFHSRGEVAPCVAQMVVPLMQDAENAGDGSMIAASASYDASNNLGRIPEVSVACTSKDHRSEIVVGRPVA